MVLSTFIQALAQILSMVINLYIWVVIIAALISWVRPDPYNPIVQILYKLTEPLYAKIRRVIPTIIGGVDLTPILVILALKFIDSFVVQLLFSLASQVQRNSNASAPTFFMPFSPKFCKYTGYAKATIRKSNTNKIHTQGDN